MVLALHVFSCFD